MKDITKIFNRMEADMKKAGFSTEGIHTVKEALVTLAENITLGDSEARKLFVKYGVYEAGYIKKELPMFFRLISDKVEEKKVKEQIKKGASKESIERQKKLEELGENRLIGYARVSTQDQNLARQFKALEEAGCQVIFSDKLSGKNVSRPEYKEMMETIKAGDTVIVTELTRLARSTTDLFNMMAEFEKKGVSVKSLKESWLDTTTAHGKLMFTIMSGMAQFERELMLERQKEGIKVAKENGVRFGVKLKEEADMDLAIQLAKEGNYTMTQIAKMCHVSRTTLWRRLKDLGIRN
ncbi:TPA: recombinase family protein [Clostridium perfringens]|nr:recombinase family protein [Clostridium perfringens]